MVYEGGTNSERYNIIQYYLKVTSDGSRIKAGRGKTGTGLNQGWVGVLAGGHINEQGEVRQDGWCAEEQVGRPGGTPYISFEWSGPQEDICGGSLDGREGNGKLLYFLVCIIYVAGGTVDSSQSCGGWLRPTLSWLSSKRWGGLSRETMVYCWVLPFQWWCGYHQSHRYGHRPEPLWGCTTCGWVF